MGWHASIRQPSSGTTIPCQFRSHCFRPSVVPNPFTSVTTEKRPVRGSTTTVLMMATMMMTVHAQQPYSPQLDSRSLTNAFGFSARPNHMQFVKRNSNINSMFTYKCEVSISLDDWPTWRHRTNAEPSCRVALTSTHS